jgi:hypothetical protein
VCVCASVCVCVCVCVCQCVCVCVCVACAHRALVNLLVAVLVRCLNSKLSILDDDNDYPDDLLTVLLVEYKTEGADFKPHWYFREWCNHLNR